MPRKRRIASFQMVCRAESAEPNRIIAAAEAPSSRSREATDIWSKLSSPIANGWYSSVILSM